MHFYVAVVYVVTRFAVYVILPCIAFYILQFYTRYTTFTLVVIFILRYVTFTFCALPLPHFAVTLVIYVTLPVGYVLRWFCHLYHTFTHTTRVLVTLYTVALRCLCLHGCPLRFWFCLLHLLRLHVYVGCGFCRCVGAVYRCVHCYVVGSFPVVRDWLPRTAPRCVRWLRLVATCHPRCIRFCGYVPTVAGCYVILLCGYGCTPVAFCRCTVTVTTRYVTVGWLWILPRCYFTFATRTVTAVIPRSATCHVLRSHVPFCLPRTVARLRYGYRVTARCGCRLVDSRLLPVALSLRCHHVVR